MDYLVYVEFNAENLQFYLWYKDYTKRFNALSENDKLLSKEWIPETKEIPDLSRDPEKLEKKKSRRGLSTANILESGYAAKEAVMFSEDEPPLSPISPPMSPTLGRHMSLTTSGTATPSVAGSSTPSNSDLASQSGMKWQPCMLFLCEHCCTTDRI